MQAKARQGREPLLAPVIQVGPEPEVGGLPVVLCSHLAVMSTVHLLVCSFMLTGCDRPEQLSPAESHRFRGFPDQRPGHPACGVAKQSATWWMKHMSDNAVVSLVAGGRASGRQLACSGVLELQGGHQALHQLRRCVFQLIMLHE